MNTPPAKQLFVGRWPRTRILMYETEPVTVISVRDYQVREGGIYLSGALPDLVRHQDVWVRAQNGNEFKLVLRTDALDTRAGHELVLYYAHGERSDATYLIGVKSLTTNQTTLPNHPTTIFKKAGALTTWFDFVIAPFAALIALIILAGTTIAFDQSGITAATLLFLLGAPIFLGTLIYLTTLRRKTEAQFNTFIQNLMLTGTGSTTPTTTNPPGTLKNRIIKYGGIAIIIWLILNNISP